MRPDPGYLGDDEGMKEGVAVKLGGDYTSHDINALEITSNWHFGDWAARHHGQKSRRIGITITPNHSFVSALHPRRLEVCLTETRDSVSWESLSWIVCQSPVAGVTTTYGV